MNIVKSPNGDVAKDPVLIIAEATTMIKSVVVSGVTNNKSINIIANEVAVLIEKYCSLLPQQIREQNRRAFKQMFMRDHFIFATNAKAIVKNAETDGYKVNSLGELFNINVNVRNKQTDRSIGVPTIKDYQQKVRDQCKVISANQPMFTGVKDGKPYKMSSRNLAEMTVRYEENLKDVQKLQDQGEDLVWTSSHVDCSIRCQRYQGKLWSISGKNAGKVIDGHKVGNLSEALQGPNKDGNGIINGYNCRHYLIPYRKGSKPPVEYDKNKIKKERDINTKQRNYENHIRQLKMQEQLARQSGDTQLAKKLNQQWHKTELQYKAFSLRNGHSFSKWRTQVMKNEKIQPTKWGDQYTLELKRQIKNKNAINIQNYQKIVKSSNGKINCDERIIKKLDENIIYKDFNGNEIKIRERDKGGCTGVEHISQAKHNLKEKDIDYIGEALLKPNDFIKTELKGNMYILKGEFGINNEFDYLVVCVGNKKSLRDRIVTVYAIPESNYNQIIKKHKRT